MRVIYLALAATIILGACGESNESGADAGGSDVESAPERTGSAAEVAFRVSYIDSCVASAVDAGAPEKTVRPICECSADKVLTEVGVVMNVPDPIAKRVIAECVAENRAEPQGQI